MIKMLRRKYKDVVKIFAGLGLEVYSELIFRIVPRFITDPGQDPGKNA